jgi:hypothetical protein
VPMPNFHETVCFIEMQLPNLQNKYELTMLDPNKTYSMNVPAEMFDKERGWRLLNYRENFVSAGAPNEI